jgi:hypothetical protein
LEGTLNGAVAVAHRREVPQKNHNDNYNTIQQSHFWVGIQKYWDWLSNRY